MALSFRYDKVVALSFRYGRVVARRSFAVGCLLTAVCSLTASGCASSVEERPAAAVPRYGSGPEFEWTTIDDKPLTANDLRGRVTLLLFVTMHELGSQLMVQQAEQSLHKVVPRINAVAVLMEGPEYTPLAPAFRDGLSLSYPLVMAGPALLRGSSPFGEIDYLPTTLVLDRQGNETQRLRGPVSEAQLDAALQAARDR